MRHKLLATRLLIAGTSFLLTAGGLELALRPFANLKPKHTLYQKDPELGWKLRPNGAGTVGKVKIRANAKGLHGPEIDYDKRPGVLRILYLGDSVTFGYGLAAFGQAYPWVVEQLLAARLHRQVETVNTAVSGYSTWQEKIFLEREGVKYHPDLVVVGFVLNDVTERFRLKRFGGQTDGWMAEQAPDSWLDYWLSRSAAFYFARKLGAWIRFGSNVEKGARRNEARELRKLVREPDRPDLQRPWQITFADLQAVVDSCRARRLPLALVLFPCAYQLAGADDSRNGPQQKLLRFGAERGLAVLDLLPGIQRRMREKALGPRDYYLDETHLNALGNRVAGELLEEFLATRLLGGEAAARAAAGG